MPIRIPEFKGNGFDDRQFRIMMYQNQKFRLSEAPISYTLTLFFDMEATKYNVQKLDIPRYLRHVMLRTLWTVGL